VPFVTLDQAPADLKSVTYHVGGDPCADGKVAGEFFVKAAAGKRFKLLELQGGLANHNASGARSASMKRIARLSGSAPVGRFSATTCC
jgi:ABC-type sugar transport system substrate-binding protein